jgi:hypothetical protein
MASLLVLMACACAGRNPDVAWDALYDFSSLRTYDWAPKEAETGPNLPYDAIDRAVKRIVDEEMRASGFVLSSDNPTFRLTYYVGVDEIAAIEDEAYYGPGWGAYWGYGWYGPIGVNVSQYDRNTITLDVLSTDPGVGLVWRGIARTNLLPNTSPERVEGAVRSALRDVLEDFPPQPGE